MILIEMEKGSRTGNNTLGNFITEYAGRHGNAEVPNLVDEVYSGEEIIGIIIYHTTEL